VEEVGPRMVKGAGGEKKMDEGREKKKYL